MGLVGVGVDVGDHGEAVGAGQLLDCVIILTVLHQPFDRRLISDQ